MAFVEFEFGFSSIIVSASDTELVLRIDTNTNLRIIGSGFTYGGGPVFAGAPLANHLPTGGSITTVVLEAVDTGTLTTPTLWTLSGVQVGLGDIGALLAAPLALRGAISWIGVVNDDGGSILFTETQIRLINSDGTFTDVIGTGFGQEGDTLFGEVTAIKQIAADGVTELNSVSTTLSLAVAAMALSEDMAATAVYRLLQTGANTITAGGLVTIFGDTYSYDLVDGAGNDTIIGGAGSATVDYYLASAGVTVDLVSGLSSGGGGSDVLIGIQNVFGSFYDDVILGNGSDNRIEAEEGNDVITPGLGNDFVNGGEGDDVVVLSGTQGAELLFGSDGFDTLRINGSSQVNLANSQISQFEKISFVGADPFASVAFNIFQLLGGSLLPTLQIEGNDNPNAIVFFAPTGGGTYSLASTSFLFLNWEEGGTQRDALQLLAPGNQTVTYNLYGSTHRDVLVGARGADFLSGGDGNDTLTGGIGADTVDGGAGDDLIVWAGFREDLGQTEANQQWFGGDVVIGGDGLDDIVFQNSINLLGGPGSTTPTGAPTSITGVERITFAASNTYDVTVAAWDDFFELFGPNLIVRDSGNLGTVTLSDTLEIEVDDGLFSMAGWVFESWGDEDFVEVYGGTLADSITGSEVDDTIFGAAGNDLLGGGDGDDVILGEEGGDIMDGGAGNDWIVGGQGTDTVFLGQGGANTFIGGDDVDFLAFYFNAPGAYVNLTAGAFAYDGGWDGFVGFEGVSGTDQTDVLIGDDGDNRLLGQGGDDTLVGGLGADRIFGGDGLDWIVGGEGDDVLGGGAGVNVLIGGAGLDLASYAGATAGVWVNLDAGVYSAEGVWDVFLNGEIEGAEGSVHADTLFAATAGSVLRGLGGDDALIGRSGDDTLEGGDGFDWIVGGAGNDRLVGGAGVDVLTGGEGADVFDLGAAAGWDVAFDFNVAEDRFALGGLQWLGFLEFDADGDGALDTLLGYDGGNFVALGVSGLTLEQWNALVIEG